MPRLIFLFSLCLACLSILNGQAQGVTITGRIVDAETLDPLPYAHVFIDLTTIVAVSDENGEYVLEHVLNGDYKVVFSYVGYEFYYQSVSINDQDLRVSARLIPQKELLQAVEVKGEQDKEWERQLTQFNKVFFGEFTLAKDCQIINPWVLDFTYRRHERVFSATASAPLQIVNNALGYQIECTLQLFTFDKNGYKIKGLYKFEEINTKDLKVAQKWTRNRRHSYQNSLRFLFKSIVENRAAENGLKLYLDKRPVHYIINSGTLSQDLGKHVFDVNMKDYITPIGRPGFYEIALDGRLEIHHTTEFADAKTYRDVSCPVSWVEFQNGKIFLSSDGIIVNSDQVITSGELNNSRIASMLPINYSPGSLVVVNYITKRKIAKRLQERAYVKTDKGFYYPGEKIWFNSFLNYANQSIKDSLSTVLYVDLINPAEQIVDSKILKIIDNMAHGDFLLEPQWSPGIYHVRAYTSWMENYGAEIIFHAPIAIMNKDKKLLSVESVPTKSDFSVTLEKSILNSSEEINLSIQPNLLEDDSLSLGSISVTEAGQGTFPGALEIQEALTFPDDMPKGTLADFTFPVEYGFGMKGRLYRVNKKNTTGQISIIQGKMDSLYYLSTDRKGYFTLEDLNFYDTVKFSFQARDRRGRIFGKTEVLPREILPVVMPKMEWRRNSLDTIFLSEPIVYQIPKANDVLPVELDKPMSLEESNSITADFSLSGAELESIPGGLNILAALQGRVPGFQINPSTGKPSFRGNISGSSNNETLFVIDGMPVYSEGSEEYQRSPTERSAQETVKNENSTQTSQEATANSSTQSYTALAQNNNRQSFSSPSVLSTIVVDDVSRVEASTRADPRYGQMGANGVIFIYTKKAQGKGTQIKTFDEYLIEGYSVPNSFATDSIHSNFSGHYSKPVYWNPKVNFSNGTPTTISFQRPTEIGNYEVQIHGVSARGKPLSGKYQFRIGD